MSELVERVARAICETVFGPYESAEADRSDASISGQSRMATIAAIEAMREPTEAMIEEGGETYSDGFRVGNEMAREVWTSMIGVALALETHP